VQYAAILAVSDDHVGCGYFLQKNMQQTTGRRTTHWCRQKPSALLVSSGASLEMARTGRWGPNILRLSFDYLVWRAFCPGAPLVREKSLHQVLQLSSGEFVVHVRVPNFLYGRRGELWMGGIAMADYTPSKTSWSALCPPPTAHQSAKNREYLGEEGLRAGKVPSALWG